jgi:uncharacterized membrane protein
MSDRDSPKGAQGAPPVDPTSASTESPEPSGALSVLGPLKQRIDSEIRPLLQRREPDVGKLAEQVSELVVEVVEQEFWRGPLPHPIHFERYEKTIPGAADRILALTEREQAHRHRWEDRALTFEFLYSIAGLALGFLVGAGLIVAAVITALQGHDGVAGALVAASAIGMVTAFIQGREIFGKRGGAQPPAPAPKPTAARQLPVPARKKDKRRR